MIHFYPGMGATSSMYAEPWRKEFDGRFHDWPEGQGEQSITEIAERIIDEHQIHNGDTVVGTSLGGIVACEIANLKSLDRIVLIGSATKKEEINGVLSILHPLVNLTPISFVKALAGKIPGNLAEMFTHTDPSFVRQMCKAIFDWNGFNRGVPKFFEFMEDTTASFPHPKRLIA